LLTTSSQKRCAPIISILDDILLHCQSSATLEAAHNLLHTLTANPRFSASLESSAGVLNEILEDMGFAGLWRSCSFNLAQEQQDRTCFGLTEKLIEVSLFFFFFFFGLTLWSLQLVVMDVLLTCLFPLQLIII
jgi:neurofibromin 1